MFPDSSKPIAQKSAKMKKSSSFSFTQLAASAASNTGKAMNFSQLAAAAKNKKLADDSFRKWEEMRMKKLEAMNLLHRQKKAEMKMQQQQQQQRSEDLSSTARYNHQAIQPPPIKPRKLSAQSPPPIMEKQSQHRCERQQLREHARFPHRRKISLDANWYTDNIYSNQSIEDSDCDNNMKQRPLGNSASFSFYPRSHRCDLNGNSHANNININITNTANAQLHHGVPSSSSSAAAAAFIEEDLDNFELNTSPTHFKRHRNYPKSHSCNFADYYRPKVELCGNKDVISASNRSRSVPKSHSFSTNRHMMRQYEMDLIEYQRYKRKMMQLYANSQGAPPPFEASNPSKSRFARRICDREGCFSETCLVKNVDNSHNININNNIVNNNNVNAAKIFNEWDMRNQNSSYRDESDRSGMNNSGKPSGGGSGSGAGGADSIRETFIDDIDSFDDDDFIFNDGFSFQEFPCQPERSRRHRSSRNPYFSSMQLDFFDKYFLRKIKAHEQPENAFQRERTRIINHNKLHNLEEESFSMEDCHNPFVEFDNIRKQSKKMLEAEPPSRYDEDSDSCSTELDLDDFNLDFEKYWEELEDKTSSSTELTASEMCDPNNNHIERDSNNNPVHYIDDMFIADKLAASVEKILPPKKLNFPSTMRPLGVKHQQQQQDDIHTTSTKRPLLLKNISESPLSSPDQNNCNNIFFHDESKDFPKFHIIPKKTGLRISPLYDFNHNSSHSVRSLSNIYSSIMRKKKNELKSTTRPLVFW